MTRIEKLEKKYGDPFLKNMAKKTKVAQNYYALWLEVQQERRTSEIEAMIAFTIALLFFAYVGFTQAPYMGIPGVSFLCCGVLCGCNARIESLWCSRFEGSMLETVRWSELEERLQKLENDLGAKDE